MAAQINIFIPTYNPVAIQLQQAIDSILAQTCEDWTLLVHDDCSPQDPFPIVEPYLKDARITYRRSPVRLGNCRELERLYGSCHRTVYPTPVSGRRGIRSIWKKA